MKIITQYIDNILKVFGKIEILQMMTYDRPITCENENKNFKTCVYSTHFNEMYYLHILCNKNTFFLQVLLPGWDKNRHTTDSNILLYDTIGESLANELRSIGKIWGIIVCIFETDKLFWF